MKKKGKSILAILLLTVFMSTISVNAAPATDQRQVVSSTAENEFEFQLSVSEIKTGSEEFELHLSQGNEYLLRVEEGWQIENFELPDECVENFTVEWEKDNLGVLDKTLLKIKCHKTGDFKMKFSVKNLSTNEVILLTCKAVVLPPQTKVFYKNVFTFGNFPKGSLPEGNLTNDNLSEGSLPDNDSSEGSLPDNDSPEGSLPDNDSPEGSLPDEDSPEGSLPDEDSPEESELIEIDTSNWKFGNVQFVYDGTEHVVQIIGLPDWVTPVYHDNSRTNAGTNKVSVSFLVPEGYKTPENMVTEMTVEKATYAPIEFSENNLELLGNGDFRLSLPGLPEGVTASYTVNGQKFDPDHIFSGVGTYVVKTDFMIPDTENYNPINSSEVVYNVKEEPVKKPNPKYEAFLRQIASDDGTLKVEFVVNCIYSSASGMQAVLKFDDSVLDFNGIELNETDWDFCSYKPETGFMYITPNFASGMSTVGILSFVKKDPNEKISTITIDNIMILDRNFTPHNLDKVDELVTDLPRYDITLTNTNSTYATRQNDSVPNDETTSNSSNIVIDTPKETTISNSTDSTENSNDNSLDSTETSDNNSLGSTENSDNNSLDSTENSNNNSLDSAGTSNNNSLDSTGTSNSNSSDSTETSNSNSSDSTETSNNNSLDSTETSDNSSVDNLVA